MQTVSHACCAQTSSANPPTLFLTLAAMARRAAGSGGGGGGGEARDELDFLQRGGFPVLLCCQSAGRASTVRQAHGSPSSWDRASVVRTASPALTAACNAHACRCSFWH